MAPAVIAIVSKFGGWVTSAFFGWASELNKNTQKTLLLELLFFKTPPSDVCLSFYRNENQKQKVFFPLPFMVARFFLVKHPKTGTNTIIHKNVLGKWPLNIPNGHKIYHMAIKYTKWPQNIPNGRKIYQMAVKYTIFHLKYLLNLPKLGFLF
jgi:hypothetical protein